MDICEDQNHDYDTDTAISTLCLKIQHQKFIIVEDCSTYKQLLSTT